MDDSLVDAPPRSMLRESETMSKLETDGDDDDDELNTVCSAYVDAAASSAAKATSMASWAEIKRYKMEVQPRRAKQSMYNMMDNNDEM